MIARVVPGGCFRSAGQAIALLFERHSEVCFHLYTSRAVRFVLRWYLLVMTLALPIVPEHPPCNRAQRCPSHHRLRAHSLLENCREAADKNHHRTHVLHDNRAIRHQRPKLIRPQSRIPLQMIQESLLIGIVIRIRLLHPKQLLPLPIPRLRIRPRIASS